MARKGLGARDSGPKVDRRSFLTAVAAAGAASAVAPQAANATVAGNTAAARLPSALPPNTKTRASQGGAP